MSIDQRAGHPDGGVGGEEPGPVLADAVRGGDPSSIIDIEGVGSVLILRDIETA
ncbi:MAG: hypothetical protein R3B49_04900 [Phycisphaerales bacterium]